MDQAHCRQDKSPFIFGQIVARREPDWFELNDWVLLNHPELHKATRYLSSMELQTEAWMKVWNTTGRSSA